jgi:uncharacterized membrane protein
MLERVLNYWRSNVLIGGQTLTSFRTLPPKIASMNYCILVCVVQPKSTNPRFNDSTNLIAFSIRFAAVTRVPLQKTIILGGRARGRGGGDGVVCTPKRHDGCDEKGIEIEIVSLRTRDSWLHYSLASHLLIRDPPPKKRRTQKAQWVFYGRPVGEAALLNCPRSPKTRPTVHTIYPKTRGGIPRTILQRNPSHPTEATLKTPHHIHYQFCTSIQSNKLSLQMGRGLANAY